MLEDKEGKSYRIILPSGQTVELGVTKGDSLEYFSSVLQGGNEYEAINFYPNGKVKSKSIQDIKSKNTNGRKYYFSDQTGNLESYYAYRNDTLQGKAVEYYDQTANVKTTYRFIDGVCCGIQERDEFQRLTNATGCLVPPGFKKVGNYWEKVE